jgi:hypothetical protein
MILFLQFLYFLNFATFQQPAKKFLNFVKTKRFPQHVTATSHASSSSAPQAAARLKQQRASSSSAPQAAARLKQQRASSSRLHA